ncbi:hypothetical protein J4E85_001811 [Alternaria conjuncta]|uniref:uncharacterized protein n=1 Tax=Alternaria conjuncta TaxID=181017 RepID=UPI00221F733A|nr:uncharacterized protein J4E85_001811 [Alternaria conjuncta]KAI4936481.1 hypothetical protein J4E85_001811 [Alternaria conjuncta]
MPAKVPTSLSHFTKAGTVHIRMTDIKEPQTTMPVWFEQNPSHDHIPPETQRLLETWSGIPSDDVLDHVVQLREKAWKVHPYPCIGQFRFLDPSFSELPDERKEIVERLRKGQKLLDMACCVGQTIRTLANDGAPTENLYGCDLQPDFIDLGYELFRDREKLKASFLTADIFDPESALTNIQGQMDIVYAGSFFHLWGYEKQVQVSKAVVALLCPQPGSMILGRQVGATEPLEKEGPTGTMYRHNVESFQNMWKEIGNDLGINFTVDAKLKPLDHGNRPADTYFYTDAQRHPKANAIVYAEAYIVIDPNTVFVFDAQAVFIFNTEAILFAHSYTAFFHDCILNSRLEPISTTPAYYFESSGTKNTFQACSALCKADSKCLSFGYGEANCMLFDVTA